MTIKKYKRDYYKRNREKIRLQQQEVYFRNKDLFEKKINYYEEHKADILLKAKLRRIKLRSELNQRQNQLRRQNIEWNKSKERLKNYRRKQKLLTLQYLENEEYKPYMNDLVDSVSTFSLSYLLHSTKPL